MDYEKLYKDALERAKNLHKDAIDMDDSIRAKQCEIIFPELKENEDEKIRNLCEELVRTCFMNELCTKEDKDECIAWLEKQGMYKFEHGDDNATKVFKNEDGTHSNISQLERVAKKEPNPVWSEEDISNINYLLNALCGVIGLKQIQIDKLIKWLKSLKDRVQSQPQKEWSEDDERMHNASIRACQYMVENFENSTRDYEDAIDWLKSLKDRYSWKPSKEQMKGIDCAIKTLRHQLNVEDKRFNSLYEQLKKL